ncbi:MAG TPA: dihydroorotate dehydrogenase electron transfer subunit [Vicinamibacteria bacterium]|nr:dihydroorotate dehydrogenase electron transfer subunit [Vicinamibacteria bacterium]
MPQNLDVALVERVPLDGPYTTLTFRHPVVARDARPGQFVMIKAGLSADPPLRRPFSILATDAAAGTFSIFLKAVGSESRALAAMETGELAQCLGPLGRPFAPPPLGTEALMVAGGYGIAPFLMLSRDLMGAGGAGRVFYGGRTASDLHLRQPFDALGVPLVPATEDRSLGHPGRVTEPLERYLDSARGPAQLYACGPDAMLHAVARIAEARGLPCQVSLDPWMGCGVGTCLGCVVWTQRAEEPRARYRCACTEGPVFDASIVVWPGETGSSARRGARKGVERT